MGKQTIVSIIIGAIFLTISGYLYLHSGNGQPATEDAWSAVSEGQTPEEGFSSSVPVQTEDCTVYICGAVRHPGVYHFSSGARVCDAVEAAGGFTKKAVTDAINQARILADGEQITIPKKTKKKEDSTSVVSESGSNAKEGLVNINEADQTQLMTLPGIGEAKAKAIVEYRQTNGNFQTIEDIMKISGIKDGVFHQIKDSITV